MKITEEVYAVGGGRYGLGISNDFDCNVFLIDGGSELALVDEAIAALASIWPPKNYL